MISEHIHNGRHSKSYCQEINKRIRYVVMRSGIDLTNISDDKKVILRKMICDEITNIKKDILNGCEDVNLY